MYCKKRISLNLFHNYLKVVVHCVPNFKSNKQLLVFFFTPEVLKCFSLQWRYWFMEIYSYTLLAISYDISSLELLHLYKRKQWHSQSRGPDFTQFHIRGHDIYFDCRVQCVNNQYFVHTKYIYYVPNYMSFLILNLFGEMNSLACSIFV